MFLSHFFLTKPTAWFLWQPREVTHLCAHASRCNFPGTGTSCTRGRGGTRTSSAGTCASHQMLFTACSARPWPPISASSLTSSHAGATWPRACPPTPLIKYFRVECIWSAVYCTGVVACLQHMQQQKSYRQCQWNLLRHVQAGIVRDCHLLPC